MANDKPGAPEGNGNAERHGLYSDREFLYQRLSDDEKKLAVEISQDLFDRVESVGAYEREAIRNIAVDTIKRWRANEYIIEEDVFTEASNRSEAINKTYSRIVRDTTKELEKLGLLTGGPEMKKAEAQEGWMDAIGEASKQTDEDGDE